jgi:pyruvate ferredoxin oxidoreductase alpha subunit
MNNVKVMEGSEAVALAVKACRPHVISAFPISPQTHIVEGLARMVADREIDSEYIRVESEFSAASVLAGASAAGSRSYTASSSQGLLLMAEVLYASAGMRLPFVITGVNRSISAPINIQVDHQDTMSLRDSGLIQFYVESVQEAYDIHLAAFKITEESGIMLPVMVCMDGWVLTHSYERVELVDQEAVDKFLPPFQPEHYLDPANPKSWGSYAESDVMMEFKYAIHKAMLEGKPKIKEILDELSAITGRENGGLIEAYRTKDADVILVAMGSVVGTIKDAVDDLRNDGKKVGLVKIRCYRPFPHEEILQAVKDAKVVAVMDANFSMGSEGAVGLDLKAKLVGVPGTPVVIDYIAGLGGREINAQTIAKLTAKAEDIYRSGHVPPEPEWIDLNQTILP